MTTTREPAPDHLILEVEPEPASARVIPLSNVEQIIIDGDQVTLSDHNRHVVMTKREFTDLRGGCVVDLPVDKKAQIDMGQHGEQIITIDGEAPVVMAHYSTTQKVTQACVNFTEAAALTYLAQQFIPYGGSGFNTFVLNGIVLSEIREWVTKELPQYNYYRAQGNGNFWHGALKMGLANGLAYAFVGAGTLAQVNLISPDNSMVEAINNVMSIPAYQIPIIGTAGYLTFKFLSWAGKKSFDACFPGYEEMIKVNPDLTLIQLLAQYGFRWLNDVAMTEAILYYVAAFGSKALADNNWFQMTVLLTSDLHLQVGEFFAYEPFPRNAITGTPITVQRDIEQGAGQRAAGINTCDTMTSVAINKGLVFAAICFGAYMVSEVTAAIIDVHDPSKENTLPKRAVRFGAALGLPFALKFSIESVLPRVSQCCSTLFSRRASEERPLLIEDNAPSYGASQRS